MRRVRLGTEGTLKLANLTKSLVIVAPLVVAGCGDDGGGTETGDDASTGTPTATTNTTGMTDEPATEGTDEQSTDARTYP